MLAAAANSGTHPVQVLNELCVNPARERGCTPMKARLERALEGAIDAPITWVSQRKPHGGQFWVFAPVRFGDNPVRSKVAWRDPGSTDATGGRGSTGGAGTACGLRSGASASSGAPPLPDPVRAASSRCTTRYRCTTRPSRMVKARSATDPAPPVGTRSPLITRTTAPASPSRTLNIRVAWKRIVSPAGTVVSRTTSPFTSTLTHEGRSVVRRVARIAADGRGGADPLQPRRWLGPQGPAREPWSRRIARGRSGRRRDAPTRGRSRPRRRSAGRARRPPTVRDAARAAAVPSCPRAGPSASRPRGRTVAPTALGRSRGARRSRVGSSARTSSPGTARTPRRRRAPAPAGTAANLGEMRGLLERLAPGQPSVVQLVPDVERRGKRGPPIGSPGSGLCCGAPQNVQCAPSAATSMWSGSSRAPQTSQSNVGKETARDVSVFIEQPVLAYRSLHEGEGSRPWDVSLVCPHQSARQVAR